MKIAHLCITQSLKLPLYVSTVKAGFPSPADDYLEGKLDLNEHLIKHPSSTFFIKVSGDSMTGVGIRCGDTLIIDRSLTPFNNDVVLAILDGSFTVKRYYKNLKGIQLIAENSAYRPIEVKEGQDFEVWGVVIHVIHSYRQQ